MTNEYCEKHEFPANYGYRCPDCVEIEGIQKERDRYKAALEEIRRTEASCAHAIAYKALGISEIKTCPCGTPFTTQGHACGYWPPNVAKG